MIFFDTHFHLDSMKKKGIDLTTLGPLEGMDIGCEPGDWAWRKDLVSGFEGLYFSYAAGPWCAGKGTAEELTAAIEAECMERRPHFIGEIGIDNWWKYGEAGEMEHLFRLQLSLAARLDLPVSIHNREADGEIISALRDISVPKRGIIHCFSSNLETAKAFLDLGYHISFAGNVTYKSNEELRRVAGYVPLDMILLETDSPYLAPVPLRGKLNSPLNIEHTYALVASLKGITKEELNERVKENFQSIL